jgi:hypothetical protein
MMGKTENKTLTRRGRLPRQELRRMPDRRYQHTLDYRYA